MTARQRRFIASLLWVRCPLCEHPIALDRGATDGDTVQLECPNPDCDYQFTKVVVLVSS